MAVQKNTNDLIAQAGATQPDNTTQQISPQDVREMSENLAVSNYNKITDAALVGLKDFNTLVTYDALQGTVVAGKVYISNKATGPGAFVPADWDLYDSLSAADKAKLDFITVTGAADLDQMQQDIAALDGARINKGTFSPSLGVFPGGGTAQDGWTWIAIDDGVIDGMDIKADDAVVAVVDNAGTGTAADWHLQDNSDKVNSVNGKIGTVVLTKTDVGLSNVPNVDATDRANHTGTQTASTISDFDTEVANNTAVAANTAKVSNVTTDLTEGTATTTTVVVESSDGTDATLQPASATRAGVMPSAKFSEVEANTAKVTNATHTGEVTGSGALTVDPTAVSNKANKAILAGTEKFLIEDGGVLKHVLASDVGGSIYTTNGTLTGARTVTMAGNDLAFKGGSLVLQNSSQYGLNFRRFDDAGIRSSVLVGAGTSFLAHIAGAEDLKISSTNSSIELTGGNGQVILSNSNPRVFVKSQLIVTNATKTAFQHRLYDTSAPSYICSLGGNLGVGLQSPTAKLHVKGAGSTASTSALLVQNNEPTPKDLLEVFDDGSTTINGATTVEGSINMNNGVFNIQELTSVGTPAAGFGKFYAKNDGKVYYKNNAGTDFDLTSTGDNIYTANGTLSGARSVTMGGNNLTLTGGSLLMDGSINMTNGVFTIEEISGASTPAAGIGKVYAKTDGTLRYINDGGTEFDLTENIYTQNGTIGSGRTATLTDSLTIGTGTSPVLLYATGATDRIGIGTNSPTTKLDVNGGGRYSDTVNIVTSTNAYHFNILESGLNRGFKFYTGSNASVLDISTFASTGTKISFNTLNASYINTGAGLGIGLSGASAKLHVKGADLLGTSSALLVENSGGTDLLDVRNDGITTFYDQIKITQGNFLLGIGPSTVRGLWMDEATPSVSNWSLAKSGGNLLLGVDTGGAFNFRIANGVNEPLIVQQQGTNAYAIQVAQNSTGNNLLAISNNTTGFGVTAGKLHYNVAASNSHVFGTYDGATITERFTLKGTGAMNIGGLTATEASALTAANGDIVYATTTDATFTSVGFWGYEAGAWVKL